MTSLVADNRQVVGSAIPAPQKCVYLFIPQELLEVGKQFDKNATQIWQLVQNMAILY